jgi:hypothetical protein
MPLNNLHFGFIGKIKNDPTVLTVTPLGVLLQANSTGGDEFCH